MVVEELASGPLEAGVKLTNVSACAAPTMSNTEASKHTAIFRMSEPFIVWEHSRGVVQYCQPVTCNPQAKTSPAGLLIVRALSTPASCIRVNQVQLAAHCPPDFRCRPTGHSTGLSLRFG